MAVEKGYKDREWLYQGYVREEKSLRELASEAGCSEMAVRYWMLKHGIARRSRLASMQTRRYKEKQAEITAKNWEVPQNRECMARRIAESWQDPETRSRRLKARRTEEHRQLLRRRAEERMSDVAARERVSQGLREAWEAGLYDGETRSRKISASMKLRWKRGEFGEDWRRKNSEASKKAWARGAYDGVFKKISLLETEVREALSTSGVEFEVQFRLPGTRFYFDFRLPSLSVLIEVDGEHWHYSDWARQHGIIERDRQKEELAASNGFRVVRFRGRDIKRLGAVGLVEAEILPLLAQRPEHVQHKEVQE